MAQDEVLYDAEGNAYSCSWADENADSVLELVCIPPTTGTDETATTDETAADETVTDETATDETTPTFRASTRLN